MKNVVIVCIQGVTSSVMAKRLNTLAEQKNENYVFKAVSVSDIKDYLEDSDYILLTPQIKNKFNEIDRMSKDYHCEIGILEERSVSFNNIELTYNNLKSIIEKDCYKISELTALKKTFIDVLIFAFIVCCIGTFFYGMYRCTKIMIFYDIYQKTSGVICIYVAYTIGALFAKYLHQSSFIYGSICILTLLAYSLCSFSLRSNTGFHNSIDLISMLHVNNYGISNLVRYSLVVFCGLFIFHFLNLFIRKKSKERHHFYVGYFNMPNHKVMLTYFIIVFILFCLYIIIF